MGYIFNGTTKVITLTPGTTVLDVRDLYSRWKDWVVSDGAKFFPVFTVVGGDPIDVDKGVYVTSYFFLIHGWRIKPQESNHKLNVVNGVLLTIEGADPFVQTVGSYNVLVLYSQPVRSETVSTGGGSDPLSGLIESGVTMRQALRLMLSVLAGKSEGGGTTTIVFRDVNDVKNRVVATVDHNGNRASVVLDKE